MAKVSEILNPASPSVSEVLKEDPLRGKLPELRSQYKAAVSNAEITKGEKVPPWDEWLRAKGYATSNGQLVRTQ